MKKKPGGPDKGNRKPTSEGGSRREGCIPIAKWKCTSEGGKVGMMEAMGSWSVAEELASSEGVGLAEGVLLPRMERVRMRARS